MFIALYILRMSDVIGPDMLADHASNFYLTGAAFLLAGYVWLVKRGFTRRALLLALVSLALVNVVVELFLDSTVFAAAGVDVGRFNTADPLDMVAGLLALVLVGAVILAFAKDRSEGTSSDRSPS